MPRSGGTCARPSRARAVGETPARSLPVSRIAPLTGFSSPDIARRRSAGRVQAPGRCRRLLTTFVGCVRARLSSATSTAPASGAVFAGLISAQALIPYALDDWFGLNGNWFLLFGGAAGNAGTGDGGIMATALADEQPE
jgi:hypothetical protein